MNVLTTNPIAASPSGHDSLGFILEVSADSMGPIPEESRPRLYYDARGFQLRNLWRERLVNIVLEQVSCHRLLLSRRQLPK